MSIPSGARFGPYEVLSPLGAGGMGVVYLATDSRLDRQVAIKALPEHLASDPDRLSRFEREAKTLASLNHPNIAAIYGFESFPRAADFSPRDGTDAEGVAAPEESRRLKPAAQDGSRSAKPATQKERTECFLILEYVEGETLAERLDRGVMPIDEALEVCTQIAAGVEAAHEAGVIHRDLKPGNIIITPDGKVKVLDFGLAKVAEGASSGSHQSETVTSPVYQRHSPTMPGVILGTAAYMSPEQARGRQIDKRTDIWSFGVVLYECLTGANPFIGETVSDSIGAILHKEPDWSLLPPATPPAVHLLLRRCLARDRQRRQRDIGDARVDLEMAGEPSIWGGSLTAGGARTGSGKRWSARSLLLALALVLAVGLGSFAAFSGTGVKSSPGDQPVVRFSINFPESDGLQLATEEVVAVALNRAGTMMAFTVRDHQTQRILLRSLNSNAARPLQGTEGGRHPFFSPDGRWLGFVSGGRIMRAPVEGGPPLTITEAVARSLAWLDDGSVVFTIDSGNTIRRVDARGGSPTLLATSDRDGRVPDREQLVLGFDNLHAVPDASYVLAGVWDGVTVEDYDVVSVSLIDGAVRQVVANANNPQFVAPDRLLFHREGSLFAVPFDVRRGEVTGEAALVLKDVRAGNWADVAQCAVSLNGTLAYVPGKRMGPGRTLVRVDADGRRVPLMDRPDSIIGGLRVSPDESAVAILTLRRKIDLWVFDLARRSFTLVEGTGESYSPVWHPSGNELIYQRLGGEEKRAILRRRTDSTGEVQVVATHDAGDLEPTSISPDGKHLLLKREHSPNQQKDDIVLIDLEENSAPRPMVATTANEGGAMFSPDGRWFAYYSDEGGRHQVYVRAFPDGGRRWQISTEGGFSPRWSRDGSRLFFLRNDAIHVSTISTENGFSATPPVLLPDTERFASSDVWGVYDVFSDGSFVMVQPAAWELERPRLEVVVNWISELRNP